MSVECTKGFISWCFFVKLRKIGDTSDRNLLNDIIFRSINMYTSDVLMDLYQTPYDRWYIYGWRLARIYDVTRVRIIYNNYRTHNFRLNQHFSTSIVLVPQNYCGKLFRSNSTLLFSFLSTWQSTVCILHCRCNLGNTYRKKVYVL